MIIEQDILDYLDLIDAKYVEAKEKGLSRLDVEWGIWSGRMNREIRKKRESGEHPQKTLLHQVFVYWQNRSQLLEAHFEKSRFFGNSKIKKLSREGKKIKKEIMDGKAFKSFQ